ncbi:unnamed protein product, partial [Mycena citricolor]
RTFLFGTSIQPESSHLLRFWLTPWIVVSSSITIFTSAVLGILFSPVSTARASPAALDGPSSSGVWKVVFRVSSGPNHAAMLCPSVGATLWAAMNMVSCLFVGCCRSGTRELGWEVVFTHILKPSVLLTVGGRYSCLVPRPASSSVSRSGELSASLGIHLVPSWAILDGTVLAHASGFWQPRVLRSLIHWGQSQSVLTGSGLVLDLDPGVLGRV